MSYWTDIGNLFKSVIKDGKVDTTATVELGDITIDDVGITSLPSGNLDQRAKTASLSVVPASDIPDATYLGDIKFGEALPSGTNLVGKVSIDQVTANANEVVIKSAIPSGTNVIGQTGIDQTTDGTTNKVQARNATHGNFQVNATIQINDTDVSSTNPVAATSYGDTIEVQTTRPSNTTAYTALDVVGTDAATNMEFASVIPVAGNCIITGAYMRVRTASVPSGMTSFRLHLYSSAPTAITDNLAFNIIDADRSKYLGFIELDTPVDIGDNILWTQKENINMVRKLASTSIFGVLQTVTGFTPTSACIKDIGLCVLGR
jgi:hypothetical protein